MRAAFRIPSSNTYLCFSLPPFTSIFHAEQIDIFTAAHHVNPNCCISHNFLIVSGSLAALQSLSSPPSHVSHSLAPHFKLFHYNNQRHQFHFHWVPSCHVSPLLWSSSLGRCNERAAQTNKNGEGAARNSTAMHQCILYTIQGCTSKLARTSSMDLMAGERTMVFS